MPAGNRDGGQWAGGGTGDGSVASVTRVADDDDSRRYSVNLLEEEVPNGIGHAIRDHVRKTDAELIENMERKTYRDGGTTLLTLKRERSNRLRRPTILPIGSSE